MPQTTNLFIVKVFGNALQFSYSPLGNSMRSHVLLRLVGGKELWKSMRAASSLCLENIVLIIDTFTCVFARLEFT